LFGGFQQENWGRRGRGTGKKEDWGSSGSDGKATDAKGYLSLLTRLSCVSVEADGKSEIS